MNASTPAHAQSLAKRDLDTEGESVQDVDTKRTKLDHGHDISAIQSAQEMSGELKVEASSMSAQQGHVHKEERKKKGEKRDWASRRRGTRQEREQPINDEEVEGDDKDRTSTPRLPKRLCALLIGFCGSGYKGMQIQPSEKTIEGVLFKALVNAGAVSKDNADDPVKVGLQRAARTDAGVHAAGNVVSMKIITHVPGIPDLVQRVNEELPPEIRLWSFQRVQNSFNARISCDSRRYTYFFPSYLLIPPKPTSAFYQSFIRQSSSTSSSSASSSTIQVDPFWENALPEMTREEDMVRKKSWRVGKEKIEALREAAKHFEGTHNFHNFTVGRDTKDRSCFRHMKKIEVADPAVYGETEWISVMLHGQSFMLHQIRKMMCVLVMSVRTGTPSNIINALFGPLNVVIPKMPSLGLLLENPIFESYSKRVETANSQKKFDVEHTDYRAPIDFDKHAEEMQKFKEEHIYSRMRENEEKLQVFDRWQSIFDHYNGNDLLYYNTQGIIPSAAVVKKGESRPNPFRERKHFDATDFASDAPATVLAEEDAEEEEAEREEKMNKKELEEAEG